MDILTLGLAALWLGQRKQTSLLDQRLSPYANDPMRYVVVPGTTTAAIDPVELNKYRQAFAAAGRPCPL